MQTELGVVQMQWKQTRSISRGGEGRIAQNPQTLRVCEALPLQVEGKGGEETGVDYRMAQRGEAKETGHICHSWAMISQTTYHLNAVRCKADLDILTRHLSGWLGPFQLKGCLRQWMEWAASLAPSILDHSADLL